MDTSVPSPPHAADGSKMESKPWRRGSDSRFVWVAPSPSPAEVSELESHFPEVIQVPVAALEAEAAGWQEKAIIARSFHRWVPPDAIIREFRRAGLPGGIEALSLSHRCYIFKFAELRSREMALGRPWTVNGQPIATVGWSPEFIPSPDSVASALLWVRLPNLPLEFWSEEILSTILAPAGVFISADSSTKEKSRGSFARACVRVDLRQPLRPGARIRGTCEAFWQQFAYEHLDGICPSCGSIHLDGPCSAGSSAAAPSSAGAKFGPWMAALRQRRASPAPPPETRRRTSSGTSSASGPRPEGAWQEPVKVARRKSNLASGQLSLSVAASAQIPVTERVGGGVMVPYERAGPSDILATVSPEAQKHNSQLTLYNPFALLDSNKWSDQPSGSKKTSPGPSKRARPEETQLHRVSTKNDKRKGKMSAPGSNRVQVKVNPSAPLDQCATSFRSQGVFSAGGSSLSDSPTLTGGRNHESTVSCLKDAIMGQGQTSQLRAMPTSGGETAEACEGILQMDSSRETSVVGTLDSECLLATEMLVDNSGALPPSTST